MTMTSPVLDKTPIFTDLAGDHLDHVEQLLYTRPPTTQDLLAQHPPVQLEVNGSIA